MEQKMITIPFEVEKAKKIQAGELPGKIVTHDGRNARIVCWDRKTDMKYHIVALLNCDKYEDIAIYSENGESNKVGSSCDLMLQVTEWIQYKEGDILVLKSGIVFIFDTFGYYPQPNINLFFAAVSAKSRELWLPSNVYSFLGYMEEIEGYATEEQKQQLIDALKASTDPRAKEYLKRFFGIEEKQECEFEFLQPVLVRANPSYQWLYGNFTHMSGELHLVSGGIGYKYCIPYNEHTKHLLGTTNKLEEQQ